MTDSIGRKIDYLRISVTDRCNLRCRYCMPKEGVTLGTMQDMLTYEEIITVVKAFAGLGITKIKISGGEPLVRRNLEFLIESLCAIDGITEVTITTNGVLLSEHAQKLYDAGVRSVNVSLDTLSREKYLNITGFDELYRVLDGIDRALRIGMKVKINSVLCTDFFDGKEEFESNFHDLTNLVFDKPVDVRFIELMPIGTGREHRGVSEEELKALLIQKYGKIMPDNTIHGNGPAKYVKLSGSIGSIGFISPLGHKFCNDCNRIRLTSTGILKPCLCYEEGTDLRAVLRKTRSCERTAEMDDMAYGDDVCETDRILSATITNTVNIKRKEHCFEHAEDVSETRKMSQIGG